MDEGNERVTALGQELAVGTESRYTSKMPDTNDVDLNVLKGHLLVEEKLDALIEIHFPGKGFVKKMGLNFNRKTNLARAICERFGDAWFSELLWAAIYQLNEVRNKVAHDLDDMVLSTRIVALGKTYGKIQSTYEEAYKSQTGGQLPFLSDAPTDAVMIRSLVQWCLTTLDQLIVVSVAIEIENAKLIEKKGNEIIMQALSALGKHQRRISVQRFSRIAQRLIDLSETNEVDSTSQGKSSTLIGEVKTLLERLESETGDEDAL